MGLSELLEGESLTGRQAAIIFFTFLGLIVVAALFLIVFSDFFRGLIAVAALVGRPARRGRRRRSIWPRRSVDDV